MWDILQRKVDTLEAHAHDYFPRKNVACHSPSLRSSCQVRSSSFLKIIPYTFEIYSLCGIQSLCLTVYCSDGGAIVSSALNRHVEVQMAHMGHFYY